MMPRLIRHAIRSLLDRHPHIELVAEGTAGIDVTNLVEQYKPDILLLDLSMPQSHQPEESHIKFRAMPTIERLAKSYPQTQIILLTSHHIPALVSKARHTGIPGYLLKSDDLSMHLHSAIESVAKGGIYYSETISKHILSARSDDLVRGDLSDRQLEMILAIYRHPDASSVELAKQLGIKESTFKTHLQRAYKVLGVTNKTAAVVKCIQLGRIDTRRPV